MSEVIKSYPGVTKVQSYSAVIRDILFAKTVTLPFFEGFTARRSPQLPTQEYHLPYLGVYITNENMVSDGDWNHGVVDFIHDVSIAFSVQMENNDPVELELKLDEAYWAICNGLWSDQYMMSFHDTYNPHTGQQSPDNMRIEGVRAASRTHNWGMRNETPFGEMQYEPIIRYRSYFEPEITDDLLGIDVQAAPMIGPRGQRRPPTLEEARRIILKYEFDPKTGDPVPRPFTNGG